MKKISKKSTLSDFKKFEVKNLTKIYGGNSENGGIIDPQGGRQNTGGRP